MKFVCFCEQPRPKTREGFVSSYSPPPPPRVVEADDPLAAAEAFAEQVGAARGAKITVHQIEATETFTIGAVRA